jgi:hypothetical protein
MAADATVLGVVAITQMPFAAFHPDALRQAFVLASRMMSAVEPATWSQWIQQLESSFANGVPAARVGAVEPEAAANPRARTRWERIA